MKTVRRFNKFKDWFRLAGVILIPVLLIINMATLLTSHDGFVVVRSISSLISFRLSKNYRYHLTR